MTSGYGPEDAGVPEWTAPASGGHAPAPPSPAAPRPSGPGQRPGARAAGGGQALPTYRSWQPGIMPLRPLTFGDYLSYPFKAMRYNRGVVIGAPLVATVLTAIVSVGALWLYFTDPFVTYYLLDPYATPYGGPDFLRGETIAALVASGVFNMLSDGIARAMIAPGVARAVLGERISLGEAWKAFRPRLWSVLAILGIGALAATLAIGVVVGLGLLLTVGGAAALGVLLLVLGGIALVVGSFGYMVIMGIAAPIAVLERRGPIDSIRRAFRLVRGRYWWSVLVVFVSFLLVSVATSVIQFIGEIGVVVAVGLGPNNGAIAAVVVAVFFVIATLATYVATYAFLGAVYAFMYIDLRIRHEGFDVDLAQAAEARARR